MKKILIVLSVLIIAAFIFVSQKNKQTEISRQARAELAEIEKTAARVLNSSHPVSRKLTHMVEYLDGLIKKMDTRGVLDIPVFDREEKKRIYNRFIENALDFREQVAELKGKHFDRTKRKGFMQTLMMYSNTLLFRSPATNDPADDKNDIFAMWSKDIEDLILTDDELPLYEDPRQADDTPDSELAQLDIVDGKAVAPRVTERKFLTQETRTTVAPGQLKNYVGKEFEIQLKNGDVEEGTLLAVDARSIKLNVFLGGGRVAMPIPIDGIKNAEMITVKKTIALKQTTTTVKTDPWDEYKEMTVKPLEPVTDTMRKNLRRGGGRRHLNEGYVLVTTDYKMYWISDKNGRLMAHSPVTAENFKALATGIKPESIRSIRLVSYPKKTVSSYDYVCRPNKNVPKKIDYKKMRLRPSHSNSKISEFKPFELRFKIRLAKKVPGARKNIEIEEKDLVFNEKNTRMIVKADYVSPLVDGMDSARYGVGDKPWEYTIIRGIYQ